MGKNVLTISSMKRHITFCLCPQVPLFSIASGIEVLRHANRLADKPYTTVHFSVKTDEPVQDSNYYKQYGTTPAQHRRKHRMGS